MILRPYKLRMFNVVPEPIEQTQCSIYSLKQIEIKEEVDLRDTDSKVDDQGYLGSCAANSIINAYENIILRNRPSIFEDLSRLFLYYNTRVIEESIMDDAGVVYLGNTLESLKNQGVCTEELWPYDVEKFATKPSNECYKDALSRRIDSYEYIKDLHGMKEILSSGKPVVIGMKVFLNFMRADARNFVISEPEENDYSLGGHAVSVVGYTKDNHFIIKNSFGTDWGNDGYALITEDYMEKYVFDRWHFSVEEEDEAVESASSSIIPYMQRASTAFFRGIGFESLE
jgi:C1A family cysteine protease